MDQGTVDSPVTLVIKAPNQKYDDQTINCFLNWTVEKLKKHISNVYPSKPSSKDQKLVYSGRLLQDHLQLRDVLRKQDEYHMLHLVCSTQSPPESSITHSSASTPESPDAGSVSFDNLSSSSSSSASSPNQDGPSTSSAGSPDGLRHRGSSHSHAVNPAPPGIMQDPAGFPVPMQAGAPLPAHPMYMPMQMLWWQQMYARHYYMQYQAALAASQAPVTARAPSPSATLSPPQPPQANDPPAAAAAAVAAAAPNPGAAVAAMPEERPANPNIQMNAQGGPVLNDDELNRDWLDWMYTVSRAAILLSIVYFYASFGRFVMVIGAMLLVYLHQAGWFPFRQEQNPGGGEAPQDEGDRHNDMQEMERLMDDGMDEEEGESGEEGQQEGANAGPPYPGFLAAAWSFISTFFTSLIPEGPPHGAN